ncbi:phage tail fiber domain-containing protein, partial [Klebsiella pneumoniae]
MSVPNQTPYNIYTANGLTTVFTYEFYIISASDLQVSINGSVVASGYTVAGVGNKDGGDITFLTPPANGAVVMLERVVPTYRLTDYQDNGDLLADTVNKDFDRIWMAIQRAFIDLGFALTRPIFGGPFNANGYRIANLADPVNEQDAATKKFVVDNGHANLARTLRVPELSVTLLPDIHGRKNKILAFNDQGNPITVLPESGSAADVMIELGSVDGMKWVGKCPNIATLRSIEPSYEGQSIILQRAVSGGHEINCSLWYDADDVTTADDGYSVFVTTGGARWKADVSRGIDVRLAGLLSDNSNLGTVLNAVITGEVNKIKAAGTIKGAITNIFIPASRKVYTVDTPVFTPSFMCMNTNGYVYMLYPSTTG